MEDIKQSASADALNPLHMNGIEFIEFSTSRPEKLGAALEKAGFQRLARHRSRAVFLYRQAGMNIIVNADTEALPATTSDVEDTQISAFAIKVPDAYQAYKQTMVLGAWPIPTRAGAMELNIPGIRGVGDSIIYLVDDQRDFSIYDVDFIYELPASSLPSSAAGMHFFGLVQYVGPDHGAEWADFYAQLLGFHPIPEGNPFGILPNGIILESPCRSFYLQLIEPVGDAIFDVEWNEQFGRLAFGVPDIEQAVRSWRGRGIAFMDNNFIAPTEKGALTIPLVPGVEFELVCHQADEEDQA